MKQKFCPKPFEHLELHENGRAYLCCPSYIYNKDIGSYRENEDFDALWNSQEAKEFRQSIIDGTFKYCDSTKCPVLSSDKLNPIEELRPQTRSAILANQTSMSSPSYVTFANDFSCNLSCPSCRSEKISHPLGTAPQIEKEEETKKIIDDVLTRNSSKVVINITGSGDPFGSVSYKNVLENLDVNLYPNLALEFQTNGVLLTEKVWEKLHKTHRCIQKISISVDASDRLVYDQLRRGGSWDRLLSNIQFLSDQKKNHKYDLELNFVVQQKNVHQLVSFVKLFKSHNIDSFNFLTINDWGSMSSDGYQKANVLDPNHPEFSILVSQVVHPFLDSYPISWGTLYPIRKAHLPSRHEILSISTSAYYKIYNFLRFMKVYKNKGLKSSLLKLHYYLIFRLREYGRERVEVHSLLTARLTFFISALLSKDDFYDQFWLAQIYYSELKYDKAVKHFLLAENKFLLRPRDISKHELQKLTDISAEKSGIISLASNLRPKTK